MQIRAESVSLVPKFVLFLDNASGVARKGCPGRLI